MKPRIVIQNILKSGNQFFWSIVAFKMFPSMEFARADLEYIDLKFDLFLRIAQKVNARMIEEGITYKKFYVDDFFDCVEFADCWCNYFVQEMVLEGLSVSGRGCPVRPMGIIENERGDHACITVKIEGKLEYWEPYPEYFRKLNLDRKERNTAKPIGF